MPTYSLDLRQRVLADCDAGLKTKAVAEKYGVSRTWVRALKQRRRETGEIGPRQGRPGRKPKFDRTRLAELVAQDADATLAELRERLGVQCALSAIWKALDQLKITFKKKRCGPPSRTAPTSRRSVRPGGSGNSTSTPRGSSSSTKRGRPRT
jgi:transposase